MHYTPPHGNPDVDIHSVNVTQENPVAELGKLAVGLIALIVGLMVAVNVVVDLTITFVPQQIEAPLASLFEKDLMAMNVNWHTTDRIQAILDTLTDAMDEDTLTYDVRVVDEGDTVNAGSFPGGHMVMFQALVKRAENDDELAFVLAHELGHYHHRHHLRGLGKGIVLSVLLGSLLGREDILPWTEQATQMTLLNFSREDEYAADDFAYQLTRQAGYNPQKGMLFFDKMASAKLDWLSTHPASKSRIQRLKKHYGTQQ